MSDEWQGGGTDRRRNPERVKELEKQLAAERERYETERQAHYGYVQLAEQHLKEVEAQLAAALAKLEGK